VYLERDSIDETTVEGSLRADRHGFRTEVLTGTSFYEEKPLYHVYSYFEWSYNFI
jgi:hypothetical protein